MSNHYQQHPTADDGQHRGLGNSPEPISNPKSQELYDAAAREYRAMLTSEGKLNDTSGIRKTDHGQGNVLLHPGSDRAGILLSRPGLQGPLSDEGRAVRAVHSGSYGHPRKEPRCNQHRSDCGVAKHYGLHLIAAGLADCLNSAVAVIIRRYRSIVKNYQLHILAACAGFALLGVIFLIGVIISCALKLGVR